MPKTGPCPSQRKTLLRILPVLLLAVTMPLVTLGSFAAMRTFENDFARWPIGTTKVRQQFDQFQARFESTDILFVSWPDCTIDDTKLHSVRHDLGRGDLQEYLDHYTDGRQILDTLTNEIGIQIQPAMKRLQGSFVGPAEQTCLVLALNRNGTNHRHDVLGKLSDLLSRNGVAETDVKLAGPAFNMHSIDVEGFWSPLRAVPLITLLSFLLTWFFVRRFMLAVFINAISSYTGGVALTSVYILGHNLNSLIWTMPPLVLLLTTSASLHFLGYYRRATHLTDLDNVPWLALRMAWRPIIYCSVTTAVGLFSLLLSNMLPVKQFGGFGGLSVLASAVVVLSCLPVWLSWFPYNAGASSHEPMWNSLASVTTKYRWPIICITLFGSVILLAAIPHLQTSARINNFFPQQSRVVQDAAWFEENIGSLSTVEMVLTFAKVGRENDLNRMRFLEFLHRRLLEFDVVNGVFSPATYNPVRPRQKGNINDVLYRQTAKKKIEQAKIKLDNSGMISNGSPDGESWRISLRVDEGKQAIGPELVEQLESVVRETFEKTAITHFPGEKLSIFCTGQAVLFDFVEKQFLKDLVLTYATAFLLISIVIFLIMQSFVCVCVATPPNLFPAALVLGGVSLSGLFLDVGSLMTASVALGIAVDDTLHFFLWWREKARSGMSNQAAIVDAMNHCGMAMFQTTVVCGISIALYSYCGFLPTVRFGLLLSAMMFAALIGDLLLLPALLATRFGVWARGPSDLDPLVNIDGTPNEHRKET